MLLRRVKVASSEKVSICKISDRCFVELAIIDKNLFQALSDLATILEFSYLNFLECLLLTAIFIATGHHPT